MWENFHSTMVVRFMWENVHSTMVVRLMSENVHSTMVVRWNPLLITVRVQFRKVDKVQRCDLLTHPVSSNYCRQARSSFICLKAWYPDRP